MPPDPELPEQQYKTLPPPWDRIFSLGTRTFVWALLVAVIYILRPFFLLIFLTFVFAYIQAHGVDGLQHRIVNRALRVTIVGLVFLGTILATVFALRPQLQEQGIQLWDHRNELIAKADTSLNSQLKQHQQIWDYLVRKEGTDGSAVVEPQLVRDFVDSLLGLSSEEVVPADTPEGQAAQKKHAEEKKKHTEELVRRIFEGIGSVLSYVSSFLLSILFSFLIVLDLPKLRRQIHGLDDTKIGFIYREVADNIATFGRVLGRALEAQLFIAVVNTILTSIGMWILGIDSIPVLASMVFLCSFIPVAGVFVSSTPICLLALQDPTGGLGRMLMVIVMVLIVHAIETYILNPRIYGHHMRMNPVLVLIVLTVAGKLIGVWGLVLGIPIMNYLFRHAIRFPKDQPQDLTA
jgi:predicted PurR-regulated permease PerM